ncbi:hypothetical protein C3H44_06465 [Campylobacter jejuni]|uniref:hypothetical protein n=1 Tax=Campylobacter jejuni TaxID=197 RepID=UPI000F7FC66B|nr:hypothetical protein [Campylobacter jejuni]RTJ17078.1 hypothetical protein C3H90_01750 [Campylobacter jejuni]RTJ29155.1 hypothetical protein C3H79_01885 [Campylobacter jejuni]RTJ92446.1 hypothetical protein C3H44_06465 [Campylobacter jejuni]
MDFKTLLNIKEKRLQECQELIKKLEKERSNYEITNCKNIKEINIKLEKLIKKEILFFENLEYEKFKNNPQEFDDLEDEIYFYFDLYMINISKLELKELEFNSKVEFKKYEERYETRKDKKDFIKLSKSILQTLKDLFQVTNLAGFSIIIFILILHSLQTKTIPFLDSQKATALAITGVLFGGIFSFFYMGIFSFSRELYKQYFKIPKRIPFIIYITSSIITFITLQKPNILLLISIVIVFIVANGALYFFGREYRISLNKIETFMLQTILIFIMYVSMIIVSIFIIIKSQEVNYIYLGIGHLIIFIFFSLQLCFKDFKSFKFFVLINTIILFLSIMFLNENITSYLKIGNFKVEEMTLSKNKIVKNKLLDNNISFIENEEGLKVKDLYILSDAKDVYYIQSKKEENKKLKKSFLIDKKYVLDKDF